MKVYHYDSITGIYVGETNAHVDPMATKREGREVYMLPANSSFDPIPELREGFYIKRTSDKWEYEAIPITEESPQESEMVRSETDLHNDGIKSALVEVDAKTIRSLREWLAKQETAPQYIKDYETEAIALRDQLIKG